MDQEQFRKERAFMIDYWSFRKKYYDGSGQPDRFWQSLYDEAAALEEKHRGQYCQDMLVACISDIERRARCGRKG